MTDEVITPATARDAEKTRKRPRRAAVEPPSAPPAEIEVPEGSTLVHSGSSFFLIQG